MSEGSVQDSKKKRKQPREASVILLDALVSGASAVIAKTLVAPFERVKLVLQTQSSNIEIRTSSTKEYNGIINAFWRITKEQGVLSFWRGHLATLLKYVPLQALNFTLHSKLKRLGGDYDPKLHPFKFFATNMLRGGVSGGLAIMIVYPLDYIKTKMATDLGKRIEDREFKGFTDCVKKIMRQGGIQSFYTAFPMSLLGVITYRAIYFGFYETGMRYNKDKKKNIWWSFFYAQLSTNSAGLAVYPLDTVRRNLVLQSAKTSEEKKVLQDSSILACGRRIYREKGIRGLYAGCLINLMRGFGSSLVLVLYDQMKGALDKSTPASPSTH